MRDWAARTGCGKPLLPGLGYLVAFLIVLGGLVFNIGNVAEEPLGFNTLLGIPEKAGYVLAGGLAIVVFLLKNAKAAMDTLTKILGGLMILVIFVVIVIVKPPVGEALKNTVLPEAGVTNLLMPILTLLGGTVGGYITFSGAHRLIDAGITKKENLKEINKSSVMGIGIATIVRIFLFLAILGVVVTGVTLDPPIRRQMPSVRGQEKSAIASSVWCSCVRPLHQLSERLILP